MISFHVSIARMATRATSPSCIDVPVCLVDYWGLPNCHGLVTNPLLYPWGLLWINTKWKLNHCARIQLTISWAPPISVGKYSINLHLLLFLPSPVGKWSPWILRTGISCLFYGDPFLLKIKELHSVRHVDFAHQFQWRYIINDYEIFTDSLFSLFGRTFFFGVLSYSQS